MEQVYEKTQGRRKERRKEAALLLEEKWGHEAKREIFPENTPTPPGAFAELTSPENEILADLYLVGRLPSHKGVVNSGVHADARMRAFNNIEKKTRHALQVAAACESAVDFIDAVESALVDWDVEALKGVSGVETVRRTKTHLALKIPRGDRRLLAHGISKFWNLNSTSVTDNRDGKRVVVVRRRAEELWLSEMGSLVSLLREARDEEEEEEEKEDSEEVEEGESSADEDTSGESSRETLDESSGAGGSDSESSWIVVNDKEAWEVV